MFKLRKSASAADAPRAAKKKNVKKPAAGKPKPGKPKPRTGEAAKGKKRPLKSASKTAKNPAKKPVLPVLRKRALSPRVDVGVGAVNIAPAKDQPRSSGLIAAEAAVDKKATDIALLDVREVSGICDEMLVCTARSVTHLNAVSDAVEEALRKAGERVIHRDGLRGAEPDWILLDFGDLMVHLFRPEARENYRLEDYYAEAKLVARWKND
jgi:ribosome-associated protein